MKYLLYVCTFLIFAGTMNAQADQDFKTAKKKLKKYYLDPGNLDALDEARVAIVSAMSDGSMANNPEALMTQGKIFNEISNEEFKAKTLQQTPQISVENGAIQAASALMKVVGMVEKKSDLKEALKALAESENHLNNAGIFAYQAGDFENAYKNFNQTISLSDFMVSKGEKSRLVEDGLYDEQLLYTAVSGYQGEDKARVRPLLQKLFDNGSKEPFVYEGLFTLASQAKEANALSYLETARELGIDDAGLLFAEINHYLTNGNLDELTGKLKMAIEKEPENVSIYNTTGNVYDQLAQQSRKDGKTEEADGYFDEAMGFYNQALERDATSFEANYGIGQMYYNKAADLVPQLNKLGEDYTKPGIAKYDALKVEMDAIFSQALPYFQKSEAQNGSDLNTIIALKEIYARLNDVEKANMYKEKYDKLSAGN